MVASIQEEIMLRDRLELEMGEEMIQQEEVVPPAATDNHNDDKTMMLANQENLHTDDDTMGSNISDNSIDGNNSSDNEDYKPRSNNKRSKLT
jgi:hypothetical protein